MAARDGEQGKRSALRLITCFLDSHRRVRALLHSRGDGPVMAFYDETGAQQEVVYGLLPISAILLQMLHDPKLHPEIVYGILADGVGRPAV